MARDKRKKSKKDSDNDDNKKRDTNLISSDSSFKSFLKKRAPIYLGLVALFLIFVIPELTKGSIDDVLPELSADDQQVLDVLMSYNGPDESGFTIKEAISERVAEELGDRVYSDKETAIDIIIEQIALKDTVSEITTYNVTMKVSAKNGDLNYIWIVDTDSGKVSSDDSASKYIVDFVNFYD